MADPAGRGKVGRRRLVAVQTVDIGRLTSHPVFLTPSSLIAVTGKGPRDSNESSKTTFFAAVTLLLGDPGWRPESPQTGQHATRLLFDPPNARHRSVAADHGYVVGVFAGPGDSLLPDPVTVWLRINRGGDPAYVQVRHADGIVLARGDSQDDRRAAADRAWADLGSSTTLGLRTFRQVLYGEGMTCLSYVASRGGRPEERDRTLLGSDVSQMEPFQIADELFRLAGIMPQLEREQEQRAAYADMRRDTARLEGELAEARDVLDHAEVAHAAAEQLGRDLEDAVALRRLAITRSTHQAVTDLLDDREQLEQQAAAVEATRADVAAADEQVAALDPTTLETAVRAATGESEDAADAYEHATILAGEARAERRSIEKELVDQRDEADAWDGTPLDVARQRLDEATDATDGARERVGAARADLDKALAALEAVRSGDAGSVVATLRDHGIPAVLLADEITVTDQHRPAWEARLHPFRDIVAVPPDHRSAALEALGDHPGAMLAAGPEPPTLPPGVTTAPPGGAALLALLHELDRAQGPDEAADARTDRAAWLSDAAVVVGGFAEPTLGRAAREALALRERDRRRRVLGEAEQHLEDATGERAAARGVVAAAEAAAEVRRLEEQVLPEARATTTRRQAAQDEARQAQRQAGARLAEAQAALAAGRDRIAVAEARLESARDRAEVAEREHREQRRRANHRRVAAWADRWSTARPEPLDEALLQRLRDHRPIDLDSGDLDQLLDTTTNDLGDEDRAAHTLRTNARDHLVAEVLGHGLGIHVKRHRRDHDAGAMAVEVPDDVPTLIGDAVRDFVAAGDRAGSEMAEAAIQQDDAFGVLVEAAREVVASRQRQSAAARDRAHRAVERLRGRVDDAVQETRATRFALENLMSSIEDLARTLLDGVSDTFTTIRAADGVGRADLRVTHHRPSLDSDDVSTRWRWEVQPRWARGGSDDATLVPYKRDANTAQYKLATIQLVLAALTANTDPDGRVLVLDELGANLGSDHRDRVVRALARAAEQANLTVMATVQDDLQEVAFRHCGEILVLHYRSREDLLNAPTRMLATDRAGGDAIRPLADLFDQADRNVAWTPLWDVYEPDLDVESLARRGS